MTRPEVKRFAKRRLGSRMMAAHHLGEAEILQHRRVALIGLERSRDEQRGVGRLSLNDAHDAEQVQSFGMARRLPQYFVAEPLGSRKVSGVEALTRFLELSRG
jgi:hypothetical protein